MKTTFEGIKITAKFTGLSINHDWPEDRPPALRPRYLIKLQRAEKKTSFVFWGSLADTANKKYTMTDDELLFALQCFIDDAFAGELDYGEFIREFGYDESRRAKRIYHACVLNRKKAIALIDDIEGLRRKMYY